MYTTSLIIVGFTAATVAGQSPPRQSTGGEDLVTARIRQRIVKAFDFDERKMGNYEDLPMNWIKITDAGYPWFLDPGFDFEVGHAAPPSFRLGLGGGSIGAYYLAKDIPVHPSSDYRITAWIRPEGLIHARATLTAYFLDHALQNIQASERQSQSVRGPGADEPWTRVTIDLPGGSENAAWIGLACRVHQPDAAPTGPENPRPINYRDVHGAAWFDDIVVLRLPKATLKFSAPANVFLADEPVECIANVADPDGAGLAARLDIMDVERRVVQTHPVRIAPTDAEKQRITVGLLPAGMYIARLSVLLDDQRAWEARRPNDATEILARERSFIQLNPDVGGRDDAGPKVLSRLLVSRRQRAGPSSARSSPERFPPKVGARKDSRTGSQREDSRTGSSGAAGTRHGFGLILDPSVAVDPRVTKSLLKASSTGAIKLPLWRSDTDDEDIVRGDPKLNNLLRALHGLDVAVVATLDAPPESLAEKPGGSRRTLLDVLSSPPSQWRPYLALMLARYGPLISAWQVGSDSQTKPVDVRQLRTAIANVRAELESMIGSPDLIVPRSLQSKAEAQATPADILSVTVPAHVPAHRLPPQLAQVQHLGFDRLWVTCEVSPPDRYARRSRLIEFARRLIAARFGGVENVFVPQPWTIRAGDRDTIVTPHEELILFRTLTQTLGGLDPDTPVWLGHGLTTWLFVDPTSDSGVLVAWAEADGPGPRVVVADLGRSAKRIDMWANVSDPAAAAGGREFIVDAMPVILTRVPTWRARILSSFAVDEPAFQIAVLEHERTLTLANPLSTHIRGRLRLEPPPGWQVRPGRIDIDLDAGVSTQINVGFRIPSNQAIGDYVLVGRLALEDEDLGSLTLRAPLYVRSQDINVSVLTRLDGRRLSIVHRITNLTDEAISLRTFLVVPDIRFDSHLIRRLPAGKTAVREYQIEDARPLAGQFIRVSVEQIGGPLRHNQVFKLD